MTWRSPLTFESNQTCVVFMIARCMNKWILSLKSDDIIYWKFQLTQIYDLEQRLRFKPFVAHIWNLSQISVIRPHLIKMCIYHNSKHRLSKRISSLHERIWHERVLRLFKEYLYRPNKSIFLLLCTGSNFSYDLVRWRTWHRRLASLANRISLR